MPRTYAPVFRTTLLAMFAAAPVLVSAQTTAANSPDFFETKIRPVFSDYCYGCHTSSALGGLRLDSLDAMKKGGNRGTAVVPGDPDNSLLMKAIRQVDPGLKMPLGGKLSEKQIADIGAWIKAGAVWPNTAPAAVTTDKGKYVISADRRAFWSFKPLQDPAPPSVKDTKWARDAIDRFVLARLDMEGLKPVAPASKRDLLRRATLDLIGLPPTAEEIAAFEKDNSPDAFAKVVDRLLASPHYGERWGRFWLDIARYGEDDYRSLNPNPKGYRPYPNAYAYRDWVIQAFNDDLPYDQFVKAQLAGDLMETKDREKTLPGTGFLGLGPWYYDNGSNEVTRADERHDRVDAVSRGFLGLTVACARCHDHKYDPIPQTDYYALAGVFFDTTYEEYPQAPEKVVAAYTKLEDAADEKQKILQETNTALSAELSRSLAYQTSNYLQGVWEVKGREKKDVAQVVEARKLDYELLERWIEYTARTTDRYHNKDAFEAIVKKGGTPAEAKKLADKFQDDVVAAMLSKNDIDAQNKVIADKDIDGTKPKKRTDKPSNFVSNKDFNPGSNLVLKSLPDDQNNLWIEIFQRDLSENIDPADMTNGRQGKPGVLLFRGWALENRLGAEDRARVKTLQDDLDAARKKLEPHYPFIHGVKDSEHPINIQLALRGNPENLGPEVPRHFLSVFSDGDPVPFTKGSGRLQMADLILKQPIAMRVIVNRIWKEHFGTGIVDTPSNFGFGGERPTDPELLEYLASDFVRNGMSIKKLQREIMLSSVYQLSTDDDKTAFDKDSGNRLYWRANRKRMEAEEIRDSILQVSGTLDPALGGPSHDLTPEFTRRTVYGKVSRYKLDAYLQLFDFPSPAISAEKRFTTTVPLQRLFLMNSDFVQIESEALAKRVATEADNRARIRKLYSLVYGREPNEQEVAAGIAYLHSEPLKEYEEIKNKAKENAKENKGGAGQRRPKTTPEGGETGGAEPAGTEPVSVSEAAGSGALVADAMPAEAMPAETPAAPEDANAGMGMGLMGGMGGGGMGMGGAPGGKRGQPAAAPPVKYEATVWGRYAKVLLSSSEFLFIN
ncbi:MAG TPA: DUF1549 domain-containing protein [Bryobacteraceae bacterium]|nr:DUF1549 domain-containing protein [Bryobacteraceae bacterium]